LDYTNEESRNSGREKPFSASHPSFEFSQFQPVTTECGACVNQQHPKTSFHQQLSLDSERQAGDLGAVGADHVGHASTDAGGGDVQKWTPFPCRCRGRSASSLGSGRVRGAPYLRAGCGDIFRECLYLLLERGGPFQLHVLPVSHLNQESFDPRVPLHERL